MNLYQMIQRQQELLTIAKKEQREFTDAEQREFDELQGKIDGLKKAEAEAEAEAEAREAAVTAERQRVSEITSLCREFGMSAEKEKDFIAKGTDVSEVRAAILESVKASKQPVVTGVQVSIDAADKFRAAATDALLLRSGQAVEHPADGAAELRGLTLRDIAIESLESEGETGLRRISSDELFTKLSRQFMNPTAAFPAILDSTIKKNIVEEYNKVGTTFQEWTRKGSLSDFKPTSDHSYVLGGVGDFELVPENGELKNSVPQTKLLPQRKLDTYGKQFSMSRQAFINDDIGFLSEVPAAYTAAAKKTIDKACYRILMNNPAIFDGVNLFHNDHKNLIGSGAAPSQQTIQNIILLSQKQLDQFGEPIYVVPKKLVVPVGYEFDLAVIFRSTQVTGSSNNDINPLFNYPLGVVQTPMLNAMAGDGNAVPWFMVTDGKSLQVDYLNGQETPTFRRSEVTGQLGFVWDIWLDWGINVVDYRGIYKNPGTTIA